MKPRLIALFIFAAILGCAMLAAYQHQPFEMRID
jgi:hypothetical protein